MKVWADRSLLRGYVVLMYHRVTFSETLVNINPTLRIHRDVLHSQLLFLKRYGMFIPLSDMVRRISEGAVADMLYFAVTFDDGYADNLELASPVLEEMHIPATMFVATGYVDDPYNVPWWDQNLYYVEDQYRSRADTRWRRIREIRARRLLRNISREEKERRLKDHSVTQSLVVQQNPGLLYPQRNEFTNWNRIRDILNRGIWEIGAHTETHPVLSRCSDHGRSEIKKSKDRLEDILDRKISLFAYPFGGPEHVSTGTVTAVSELGFDGAVMTVEGINGAGDDCFRLKRYCMKGNQSVMRFIARLTRDRMRIQFT